MAVLTKTIQKVTDTECIVKISGSDTAPAVITLATDIISTTQVVSGTPLVTIIGAQWFGEPGAVYRISRNNVRVITLLADNGNWVDLLGTLFPPELTNPTSDISVTILKADGVTAIQGELWLRLRKTAGYAMKVETAQFSIYDNVAAAGS